MERIRTYSRTELLAWKKHILFCLEHYKRDNNTFEIEECEFLLKHIRERLDSYGNGGTSSI